MLKRRGRPPKDPGVVREVPVKRPPNRPAYVKHVHISWITLDQMQSEVKNSFGNSKWRDVFKQIAETSKIAKLEGLTAPDYRSLQSTIGTLRRFNELRFQMKTDKDSGLAYVGLRESFSNGDQTS